MPEFFSPSKSRKVEPQTADNSRKRKIETPKLQQILKLEHNEI